MLVTVIAQFTAKITNSEKAIYFLSLMSCSINKLKSNGGSLALPALLSLRPWATPQLTYFNKNVSRFAAWTLITHLKRISNHDSLLRSNVSDELNRKMRDSFFRCTLHKKWNFPLRIWSHLLKKSLMENFIFVRWYIFHWLISAIWQRQ